MLKSLRNALFGGTCFLCRGAAEAVLCPACGADLPRAEGERCPRCALASPGGQVCGRCLAQRPRFDATVAALEYAFPADVLVHALKFRGELALAGVLGELLRPKVDSSVDLVVPVPLSPARLRQRGYNQAVEIARELGLKRFELDLCLRERDAPPQLGLPREQRRRNVRGAFRCTRSVEGKTIALVDDVMTTGATLDELATVLKKAGAARVVNWVVARTPPPADA